MKLTLIYLVVYTNNTLSEQQLKPMKLKTGVYISMQCLYGVRFLMSALLVHRHDHIVPLRRHVEIFLNTNSTIVSIFTVRKLMQDVREMKAVDLDDK